MERKGGCVCHDRLSPGCTSGTHTGCAASQWTPGKPRHGFCLSGRRVLSPLHETVCRVAEADCHACLASVLLVPPILPTPAVTPATDKRSCRGFWKRYRQRSLRLSLPVRRVVSVPRYSAIAPCSRPWYLRHSRNAYTIRQGISPLRWQSPPSASVRDCLHGRICCLRWQTPSRRTLRVKASVSTHRALHTECSASSLPPFVAGYGVIFYRFLSAAYQLL